MSRSTDIVAKLWYLCNILRESGITYPEYVTELTYLLFLKMAEETGSQDRLPKGFRWIDLASKSGDSQFQFYTRLLKRLGTAPSKSVQSIFAGSRTHLSNSRHLALLVQELDTINWYAAREEEAFADLYEGLLEKNSSESKAGAGQYFTPRALIETIVSVTKPKYGEVVQDPACGTGGFLIAAHRYAKAQKRTAKTTSAPNKAKTYFGVELVRDTHRLALMNAMLHRLPSQIVCGDALDKAGADLPPADVILTNPPFGTKRGAGLPARTFPVPTSNKQLAFLQHIYLGLKPGGRAAVVMPELVGNAASAVCKNLMAECRLHTILRLPIGIFYAAGVKTNVLFFERNSKGSDGTASVWAYDLRSRMPKFGRRKSLISDHFSDFRDAFGREPSGNAPRSEEGHEGRFCRFSREEIRELGDTLDLPWAEEEVEPTGESIPEPSDLLASLLQRLATTTQQVEALRSELGIN